MCNIYRKLKPGEYKLFDGNKFKISSTIPNNSFKILKKLKEMKTMHEDDDLRIYYKEFIKASNEIYC